jgi:excisionase family DNA binding protein
MVVSRRAAGVERIAYRPDEALEVLPVGRTALYELLRSGDVPSFKIGKSRFIPRQGLIEYVERSAKEQTARTKATVS